MCVFACTTASVLTTQPAKRQRKDTSVPELLCGARLYLPVALRLYHEVTEVLTSSGAIHILDKE